MTEQPSMERVSAEIEATGFVPYVWRNSAELAEAERDEARASSTTWAAIAGTRAGECEVLSTQLDAARAELDTLHAKGQLYCQVCGGSTHEGACRECALRADATRLREALTPLLATFQWAEDHADVVRGRAALSATADTGAWLAAKIAEADAALWAKIESALDGYEAFGARAIVQRIRAIKTEGA